MQLKRNQNLNFAYKVNTAEKINVFPKLHNLLENDTTSKRNKALTWNFHQLQTRIDPCPRIWKFEESE